MSEFIYAGVNLVLVLVFGFWCYGRGQVSERVVHLKALMVLGKKIEDAELQYEQLLRGFESSIKDVEGLKKELARFMKENGRG